MKLDSIIVPASAKEPAPAPGHAGAKESLDAFLKNTVGALDGLSAGIGQVREERTVEKAKEAIGRQLLALEIASALQKQLLPRLEKWNYRLAPKAASHPYGKPDYTYTALQGNGAELALAQLPPGVFRTDTDGDEPHVPDFVMMLKALPTGPTRLFAEDVQGITFAFRTAIEDERKGADWRFIPWADVVALREAKLEVWQTFGLAKPGPAPGGGTGVRQPKAASDAQLNLVVDVLARLAANDYPSPETAFKTLVESSGWPQEWKSARSTGWKNAAEPDARALVDYMTAKSTFPAGHALAGQSVLGDFLRRLLASNKLGGRDADTLARIVVECALVPDADTYTKYYES
jgi:hypothetical protein